MVALAKGKLSYYVLSCLAERDMYGLELIEQINNRFGVEIKLPSLYSNLNRMKELKFVSTYLKDSSKGPKCSYSSITEKGRQELETLKETWETAVADEVTAQPPTLTAENDENPVENTLELPNDDISATTDNESQTDDFDEYFDLSNDNDDEPSNDEELLVDNSTESIEEYEDNVEADLAEETEHTSLETAVEEEKTEKSILSMTENAQEIKEISEIKEEYFQNAEPEQTTETADETSLENKKLFDITQDFSKYKKRKSFTENQMIMNVKTAETQDEEKKQNEISSLRQTILNSREGQYEPIDRFAEKEEQEKNATIPTREDEEPTPRLDDGLFITERAVLNNDTKPKKIETSKLSFTIQNDFAKMPAPKRDVTLDPSCSDVKARLQRLYEKTYSKNEETPAKVVQKGAREYETYEELKDYYAEQSISFKPYDKPEGKIRHNTNILLLYSELVLFGLTACLSGLLYLIFNACGAVNADLSFLYYLFPIVSFVLVAYRFYDAKFGVSRVPRPMLKRIYLWAIFVFGSIIIFAFALVCGLSLRNAVTYCTCIIYPVVILAIWLVARQYITLYFYKRFWR